MFVSVALPVPTLGLLTYKVPDGLEAPRPGTRVLVPLGARRLTGIVVQAGEGRPGGLPQPGEGASIKTLIDVLDPEPLLPAMVVGLAEWVADYYACGPGEALGAAMPPFAWVESELRARLTPAGRARVEASAGRRAATLRGAVLGLLGDGWTPLRSVAYRLEHGGAGRRRPAPARALVRALEREGLVEVEQVLSGRARAFRTRRVAAATVAGLSALEAIGAGGEEAIALGPRQLGALRAVAAAPDGLAVPALREHGAGADVVQRLAARGLVSIREERLDRDPFAASAWTHGPNAGTPRGSVLLTGEQSDALARLGSLARQRAFAVALLHGVTGSGKTEIYLRLASEVVAAGRSALVLVPEIGLTPALAGVFAAAFGGRVAIQHSGLSDGERHDQWHRIQRGEVDVVVGTRSAVFAPLPSPGLIVVDEEHDASYKQEEAPRYHGRDVAVMRGKREGALVVLGSATPSLESYHNARAGRYELITLERRVLDRPLAAVSLVNMREEYALRGPEAILSQRLVEAIGDRLQRREQVLVLLNRRGYATAIFCRQCAGTIDCPNCSVSLTIHVGARGARRGRCHYCNYSAAIPAACPSCAAPYLEQAGFGTERVEREVLAAFPSSRVARFDRDTIRRRGAAVAMLERFGAGEIDVLVGTQMIAKGHDFPRVTLVGVVSADVGLGLADFRAPERAFQLLTQVVGRAGRGEVGGEAIIQTLHPEHYGIRHACRQDYPAFFEEELAFRRAMRYPPFVALTNGIVRGPSLAAAMHDAGRLVRGLREQPGGSSFQVLGPAPAPFVKLRGEHRAQFFIKGANRRAMREAVRAVVEAHPNLRRRLSIDVDPATVL
ncbi:MAG: primosomal protein N' [Acidobacteria bacterium]|nr:primosomal protein N' [Acidobacteriota bacterium]